MDDPAYKNGVTSESVVQMIQSVADVLRCKASHVLAPVPIDRIAPATHISFHPKKGSYPEPLRLGSKPTRSRRSQAYSLSSGSSTVSSIPESRDEESTIITDRDSTHDEIMSTINDFTSLSVIGSDDNFTMEPVTVEDTNSILHDDIPEEPPAVATNESTTNPSVPQRRRRRVQGL